MVVFVDLDEEEEPEPPLAAHIKPSGGGVDGIGSGATENGQGKNAPELPLAQHAAAEAFRSYP